MAMDPGSAKLLTSNPEEGEMGAPALENSDKLPLL